MSEADELKELIKDIFENELENLYHEYVRTDDPLDEYAVQYVSKIERLMTIMWGGPDEFYDWKKRHG